MPIRSLCGVGLTRWISNPSLGGGHEALSLHWIPSRRSCGRTRPRLDEESPNERLFELRASCSECHRRLATRSPLSPTSFQDEGSQLQASSFLCLTFNADPANELSGGQQAHSPDFGALKEFNVLFLQLGYLERLPDVWCAHSPVLGIGPWTCGMDTESIAGWGRRAA